MNRILILLFGAVLSVAAGCAPRTEPRAADPANADPANAVGGDRDDLMGDDSLRDAAPQEEAPPPGVLPSFRMIGAESGFDFERHDDMDGLRRIFESTGGGAGAFDFDRDGYPDVFMTNGSHLPSSADTPDAPGALFRNLGAMRFENVTDPSGLLQYGYGQGCAVGDFDADGFDDLYLTALGQNGLWRNNGDGTFTDVTERTGTQVPQWSSSSAFADVNLDGHLDLYVVNYLDESPESPQLCTNPAVPGGYEQCPPAKFDGVDDVLFLSDGRGGFVDVTAAVGIGDSRGKGLGVVVSDLDGDGPPEIYVANDGQANFLWVSTVNPADEDSEGVGAGGTTEGLRFEDRALASGVALSRSGYAQAGMGVAAGDYDGTGTLDLFLTHFYGDTNTLYKNRGSLAFEDVTRSTGIGAPSRPLLGWGTSFVDVDNDHWLDLIVANGHIEDRSWLERGEPFRMRPQLYRNERQGSFAGVSRWSGEYFQQEWLGRGVAVGDLDRDGRQDMVISHQLAHSVVLRNETPTDNRAVTLLLVGVRSNRNGYGARVERLGAETPVVRELSGGGSFHSASVPEVHLGLGPETRGAVRITWPSGTVDIHPAVEGGWWAIVEGGRAVRLIPSPEGG